MLPTHDRLGGVRALITGVALGHAIKVQVALDDAVGEWEAATLGLDLAVAFCFEQEVAMPVGVDVGTTGVRRGRENAASAEEYVRARGRA